jgi:hypothetical protein
MIENSRHSLEFFLCKIKFDSFFLTSYNKDITIVIYRTSSKTNESEGHSYEKTKQFITTTSIRNEMQKCMTEFIVCGYICFGHFCD